jgi:tripartite-type tricarboxylate transporter receptor subunit TctC
VIPFPPGGSFDVVGRPLTEKFKTLVGVIYVENVAGGSGSIGASVVAHAKADGHTLLLGGTITHVNEVLLKREPLYDPMKDLEPVAALATYPLAIAVHPGIPVRTLQELVPYAKDRQAELSYGHAGIGSLLHLTGELMKDLLDLEAIPGVSYRGTGPVVTDLIGGQIPLAMLGVTSQVLEFHRAGRLRILAVTSPKRIAAAPEVPTAIESGYPRLVVRGTIGLLAPAGTPAPVIEQLARASRSMSSSIDWRLKLVDAGIEPVVDSGPEQFRHSLAEDVALWAPVVKSLGVKLD